MWYITQTYPDSPRSRYQIADRQITIMDTHAVLGRRRARPDSKLEISRTKSGHSSFVSEGVRSTDPITWGHLFPVGQYKGPGTDLADRHGSFEAPKPQGYIVGRDPECGESRHTSTLG